MRSYGLYHILYFSLFEKNFFNFLKIYLFIYLFLAASGLSCGTWALCCGTQASLVVACGLSNCGAWA